MRVVCLDKLYPVTVPKLFVRLNLKRVFSYKRYESVKQLQYFCGELPFLYRPMYDVAKWNFYSQMSSSNIAVIQTLCKVLHVN